VSDSNDLLLPIAILCYCLVMSRVLQACSSMIHANPHSCAGQREQMKTQVTFGTDLTSRPDTATGCFIEPNSYDCL